MFPSAQRRPNLIRRLARWWRERAGRRNTVAALDGCRPAEPARIARDLGVTLIAYSPLAMGALSGKYSRATRATGLRRFLPRFRGKEVEAFQPVVALLREIGERYGKTPAQVALRWLMENETVLPIPGAKNAKQAGENAGALSFTLTPAERAALDEATLAWQS